MTRATDTVIVEIAEIYRDMSLVELLAEEDTMMGIFHRRRLDPVQNRLRKLLNTEIEKKLQ
ncbi:MAG: hypothetical protein ACE5KA_03330 [Nitrososphaerales archaeon]